MKKTRVVVFVGDKQVSYEDDQPCDDVRDKWHLIFNEALKSGYSFRFPHGDKTTLINPCNVLCFLFDEIDVGEKDE